MNYEAYIAFSLLILLSSLVNRKTIIIVVRVAITRQLMALTIVLVCASPLNFVVFLAILSSPIFTFDRGNIPHKRI